MVDLTIIVVSWNVRDLLARCLSSVLQAQQLTGTGPLNIEIIVIDNASADSSPEMLRARFPQVQLIVNEENRGFTAANNQGLALSRGRYLLCDAINPFCDHLSRALY